MVYLTILIIGCLEQVVDFLVYGDVRSDKADTRTLFTQLLCSRFIRISNDHFRGAL